MKVLLSWGTYDRACVVQDSGSSVDQEHREERKPTAIEERQPPTGKRSRNWTRLDPPLTAQATHSDWCLGKPGVLKRSLKPRPFLFRGVVREQGP